MIRKFFAGPCRRIAYVLATTGATALIVAGNVAFAKPTAKKLKLVFEETRIIFIVPSIQHQKNGPSLYANHIYKFQLKPEWWKKSGIPTLLKGTSFFNPFYMISNNYYLNYNPEHKDSELKSLYAPNPHKTCDLCTWSETIVPVETDFKLLLFFSKLSLVNMTAANPHITKLLFN